MYEYLDRPPQEGDIIIWPDLPSNSTKRTRDKPYIVLAVTSDAVITLDDYGKQFYCGFKGGFKVIKTKPGDMAQAGDTIIRIVDGAYSAGVTHTVHRNFCEGAYKTTVYYEPTASIRHTDVLVLCKAQSKEQSMQITDYIIDITNSTLADRLILRQVLLDNGQEVYSNIHTGGSKIYYMCTTWYCGSNTRGHNISLADFINKFKKQNKLRNLAFYKRSGEPWTSHEFTNMYDFIGDTAGRNTIDNTINNTYFYDDGTMAPYNAWHRSRPNFKNCLQVAYEDVFPITNQSNNPFNIGVKVGDRVRCIAYVASNCKVGDEFTVVHVDNNDYVYYEYRYAAHYKHFELVSSATSESNLRHQEWKDLYDKGVKLECKYKYDPKWHPDSSWCANGHTLGFNHPDIQYRISPDIQKTVESTNQPQKEQQMTIQQLLQTVFGAEKPTTDYDKRPAILVVAYNRDGSQMGQAIADNIDDVKAKVADTPELWGCKVLTYVLDQEVSVEVPVKATRAKVAKPIKE